MSNANIISQVLERLKNKANKLRELVEGFVDTCQPLEQGSLYLLADCCTDALFCECHIRASTLVTQGTVDVPLDPEEQAGYRANRELVEDHVAYERMKADALSGFSVQKIPRAQRRTADFHVQDTRHSYLVEVTKKQPAENFREFLDRTEAEGSATLSRTVDRDDRIDGVIRDKADQLRCTRLPSDFRVLWITTPDDDAKHLCEVLFRTLYGVADLFAVRKLNSVVEQPRSPSCFYYDYFSFYRHCDLQGVAFSSVSRVCLFLNPMSQRVEDFRSSELCNQFALRNGLFDPDARVSRPDVLFLDLDANRIDEKAKLQVIQDVFDGGKEVIPGWRLLEHAKGALKRGGPDGLKRYYERCLALNDPRGKRVKATLERTGRKTLESEYPRFMAAYNWGSK